VGFLLVGELRDANRRPANQSGYNWVPPYQPIGHAFSLQSSRDEVNLDDQFLPEGQQTTDMASPIKIIDYRKCVVTTENKNPREHK
jgi:hypothetical protein